MKKGLTRRDMLGTVAAAALSSTAMGTSVSANGPAASYPLTPSGKPIYGDPRCRGPFPILSTPFTETGEVDYEVLAKSAQFVDWCGCSGMIWPQSGDSVDYLTQAEKLKGMEVLTDALKGRKASLCLGVQGKNTEEMLVYARQAERLNPPCIISRPPDEGKTEEDLRSYWRELAKVTTRPVIIQTSGGTAYKGPGPSIKLLIDLAKESQYFGYVKEETGPILPRMRQLAAAKPVIKTVFSAMGGFAWLHQTRLATEGLITERAVYADILMKMWNHMEREEWVEAAQAFAPLLLMLNLKETIPCNQLRGFHLYVWIKRGVWKNMISRTANPEKANGKPFFSEMKLSDEDKAEIDARLEAIKPFLREGTFC